MNREIILELINFLENKIKGCNELGGMDKEIWAFKQVLKFINLPNGEASRVSENECLKEHCEKCGMIKHPVLGAVCGDDDCPGRK